MIDGPIALDAERTACSYRNSRRCAGRRTVVAPEVRACDICNLFCMSDTASRPRTHLTHGILSVVVVRLANVLPGGGYRSTDNKRWEGVWISGKHFRKTTSFD